MNEKFVIRDRVQIVSSDSGLTKVIVTSRFSVAEIYLHGAHLTHFQKHGEPPLIFLSKKSLFAAGKAIRGGVPICFPWFGAREGNVMHGIARLAEWELVETLALPDGRVKVNLQLPENLLTQAGWPAAKVNFIVTVGETLTLELMTHNTSAQEFVFEDCLHTYFHVGDISKTAITGLNGITYLDKVDGFRSKLETNDAIKVVSEVDRVYLNTTGTVEIADASLRRRIIIEKSGSASAVVWNPWIDKAKAMADFGDDEYKQMVCVESGNVGENKIVLAPGKTATLKVVLSSR